MFRRYISILLILIFVITVAFGILVYYTSVDQQIQNIKSDTNNRIIVLESSFYWHIKNYDLFGINNLLNIIKSDGIRNIKLFFDRDGKQSIVSLGLLPLSDKEKELSCYSRKISHVGEVVADLEYCISKAQIVQQLFENKRFYILAAPFTLLILFAATHIPSLFYGIHLNKLLKKLTVKGEDIEVGDLKKQIFHIKDKTLRDIFKNFAVTIENERKMAKNMAYQSRLAAIGQISSHLAHDMRSPLSVLETYVKKDNAAFDPEEREFKSAAARSVKKLLHMADDLVDYAKATKVDRTIVNLKKFMTDSVIMETRSKSLENNIRIRCTLDENIHANIDAYKMGRVLINLTNNSIQAISHDQGEIVISAKVESGDTLTIDVADNGKGVEKEHMPRIFDSFYTTGKIKGIGLGLSYCKQVIEAHGGRIDVESDVGKGAKFTIKIPNCVVHDYKPAIESKSARIDYLGRRFLVVDDDEDIRRNWKRLIEENGGEVAWEAGSGDDIVKGDHVDGKAIDVAIVDYNFPDSSLTGVDVIKHLRSRGIKEIHLCTGYADDAEIRSAAFAAGATSVIGKV